MIKLSVSDHLRNRCRIQMQQTFIQTNIIKVNTGKMDKCRHRQQMQTKLTTSSTHRRKMHGRTTQDKEHSGNSGLYGLHTQGVIGIKTHLGTFKKLINNKNYKTWCKTGNNIKVHTRPGEYKIGIMTDSSY